MLMQLSTHWWKMLRALAREKNRPRLGRALRIDPTRQTKDGSFLAKLIAEGLIEITNYDPDPFKAFYRATPKGLQAAEYGEYQKEFKGQCQSTGNSFMTPGTKKPKGASANRKR